MAEFISLGIDRVFEIRPKRFGDHRGFFCETYNKSHYQANGITADFVQDNHSLSANVGTLRGLHFQMPPFAQSKLVSVVSGSVFDVAVDIRPDSADFGKWAGVTLSAEAGNQIFVPAGFAHGFVTLEPMTQVTYKVDNFYSPEHDRSIRYDDPAFGIAWPELGDFELSEKDKQAPFLKSLLS